MKRAFVYSMSDVMDLIANDIGKNNPEYQGKRIDASMQVTLGQGITFTIDRVYENEEKTNDE